MGSFMGIKWLHLHCQEGRWKGRMWNPDGCLISFGMMINLMNRHFMKGLEKVYQINERESADFEEKVVLEWVDALLLDCSFCLLENCLESLGF